MEKIIKKIKTAPLIDNKFHEINLYRTPIETLAIDIRNKFTKKQMSLELSGDEWKELITNLVSLLFD